MKPYEIECPACESGSGHVEAYDGDEYTCQKCGAELVSRVFEGDDENFIAEFDRK